MSSGCRCPSLRACGFTLIEVVVTVALVGILAATATPLYEVVSTRMKESELRLALRTIRTALDRYKAAVDSHAIPVQSGESGYPSSLLVLENGVDAGVQNAINLNGQPNATRRLVFLRHVPRDPFNTDPNVSADQTWNIRSYGSPPDDPQPGADVYDVSSKSTRIGLDGVPYNQW